MAAHGFSGAGYEEPCPNRKTQLYYLWTVCQAINENKSKNGMGTRLPSETRYTLSPRFGPPYVTLILIEGARFLHDNNAVDQFSRSTLAY